MSDTDPYQRPDAPAQPGKAVRIGPLGWTMIGLLVLAANIYLWPYVAGSML